MATMLVRFPGAYDQVITFTEDYQADPQAAVATFTDTQSAF